MTICEQIKYIRREKKITQAQCAGVLPGKSGREHMTVTNYRMKESAGTLSLKYIEILSGFIGFEIIIKEK